MMLDTAFASEKRQPMRGFYTGRNLGVIFGQDISLSTHNKQICRTVFIHLDNISKI